MKASLFLIILLSFINVQGQKSELFRTIYSPAEPYGGEKELKAFIRQEIVYPEEELEKEIEAEVFITFKINNEGEVIYKEIADNAPAVFRKEAERIFDKIRWVKDKNRREEELGYEKLRIDFSPKKYRKAVKKRGYDRLPVANGLDTIKPKVYSINTVSKKPELDLGMELTAFLNENFKYPSVALQQGISGRVTVEFILEPYGLASNIRVVEPVGGGCNEETVKLVRMMKWKPAIVNGLPVRCLYEYQLNFVNPGGTVR